MPFLQDVVDGIEDLQHHQKAMEKIPFMISMECIPPQMTQSLIQVEALHQFLSASFLAPSDPHHHTVVVKILQNFTSPDCLIANLSMVCRK